MIETSHHSKVEMNQQYCDLLTSLLLAHYFADDSDVAIRQCAKRVGKRIKNNYVKKIIKGIRDAESPFDALSAVVSRIENRYPIMVFLALATTTKE